VSGHQTTSHGGASIKCPEARCQIGEVIVLQTEDVGDIINDSEKLHCILNSIPEEKK
jgi:hypothetical protein